MKKNYKVMKKTQKIFVRTDKVTEEELKEIEKYRILKWGIFPMSEKKEVEEKEETINEITEEFNIDFDKVKKEEMIEFIKKYHPDDLKDFAINSHKDINGETKYSKKGKPTYQTFAAKIYFFKKFFPDRWANEIEPKRKDRFYKESTKAKKKSSEAELLALLG